jgi:AraC-like DNA-binding protein
MFNTKPSQAERIQNLMIQTSRTLGLRLCFHDVLMRSGLPESWRIHSLPFCMEMKAQDVDVCRKFDVDELRTALTGNPDVRIHTCPNGCTEIAVPVICEGLFAGMLFAGLCWRGKGDPPDPQLVRPPNRQWLEDRRLVLKAVATELAQLLIGHTASVSDDRQTKILKFLNETMEQMPTLEELARVLCLSPSRAGHLVRKNFDMTFPQLVQKVKLRQAAHLLSSTDHPIGEIAALVGFEDQSYFARIFKRSTGLSPRIYRRRYPTSWKETP